MDDKSTSQSSTQSSTQNQSQSGTSVTTPNTPQWISDALKQLTGQVTGYAANPSAYAPQVASPLQSAAFTDAAILPGVGETNMGDAINSAGALTGTTAPTITGSTISTADINRLMSPYTSDVVNASTGLFDKQAGEDQAAYAANAGLGAGAFGSSGYALGQSNLTGTQALDRANLQSGLLSAGYTTALTGAEQDAAQEQAAQVANQNAKLQTFQQQLAAAMGEGSLASTANQNSQGNIALEGSLGATQQGQQTAATQFNPTFAAQLLSILQQLPVGALSGSTTAANSNATGTSSGSSSGSSNSFGFGTDLIPKISFGG